MARFKVGDRLVRKPEASSNLFEFIIIEEVISVNRRRIVYDYLAEGSTYADYCDTIELYYTIDDNYLKEKQLDEESKDWLD